MHQRSRILTKVGRNLPPLVSGVGHKGYEGGDRSTILGNVVDMGIEPNPDEIRL
jgi:hypothetical protein